MQECVQVSTSVEKREDAEKLAGLVLERRLAACVQISSSFSMYHWQGKIEQADEFTLVMKSFAHLYPQLEKFILDHHPYDTPEILAVAVQFYNRDYFDWMAGELKQE